MVAFRTSAKPDNWMADLDRDLGHKTPEEWLAESRTKRDELAVIDREIRDLEKEEARVQGRLTALRRKHEEVRRAGEHAFSKIAETLKAGL